MPSEEAAGFDAIFRVLDTPAYRDAIRDFSGSDDLADDVVPFSFTTVSELDRIAEALALQPGEAFVDMACGLGGAGLWVARASGASLTGVDLSEEAARRARRRASAWELQDRATFVVADMIDTGLPAGAFAGVMSIDAIPFVDAGAVLREIARLLRPGGMLVATAFESDAAKRPTVVADYRPYFDAVGLRVLTHEELPHWRKRQEEFYAAILRRAERLRAEMGEIAETLLSEAAHTSPNRRVFMVAKRQ